MEPNKSRRWVLLEEWFERLDVLDPAERRRSLVELSRSDPGLSRELGRLFAEGATEFFDDLGARIAEAGSGTGGDSGTEELYGPGERVNQFEILGELGRGGMGVVYRARDLVLERDVAMKFLPPRISRREASRERFMREARAISHIEHANLCTIHDVGTDDQGRSFIVMAAYEGQTLREHLDSGSFDPSRALDLFVQTARGLAAAHAQGVVHRDIKPDNLFITDRGQVKILDFGIAKALEAEALTSEGARLGTVSYMSPEQAQGMPVSTATDVWSLGVVMFEVLNGRRPFEAPQEQALIYAIVNAEVPSLAPKAKVDPGLVRLVERCLKREPSERFESGSGLLEAMAAAGLASSGLVSSGHLRKWAPAYLAGCLVAVVLGVLIWQGAGSARPARYSGPLTVAVQPFADLTAGGKSAGIAEGLAADLLTRLGGLPGLRLIRSRKVGPDRLKAYGDSLSAQYFVTGHVQSDPENLRVFASLYDVADGSLRWTGSFDRAADRPLDVQSEIAEAIVGKLALELTQDDLAQLGRENGPNLLAQDAYLRGMSLVLNRTPGDLAAAAAHFFESTQLDPNFPDAWSGYAYSRMLEAGTAYSPEKGSDDYEDARAAALHALRLDPRQALAMTTLASIYSEFDWDVEKADSAFALAIAENPNSAEARHLHASHLAESGRLQLALAEQRLAGLLDPESLIHPTNLGLIQFYRRDNEASLRAFDEVIERDPTFYMAHLNRSLLMVAMGQPEASLESLSKAERLVGPQPVVRSLQASALAAAGKESESREILAELSELAETRYVSAPLFAQIYLALSDTSRALDYLELGLRDHDVYLTVMRPWPFLDVVRDNPRFQRVLEGMGRE